MLAEAVDNPLNVGSIVRNSLGMGWQGLVLDTTSVDPLARRAMRVSMGNSLHLPNARTRDMVATVRELVPTGWQVVALTPADDALPLDEVPVGEKVALLVGSERAGLTDAGDGRRHPPGEHSHARRRRQPERGRRHSGRLLGPPTTQNLRFGSARP